MVAKWYNSNAALAAGMVGISSEDIRKFSRGVVSRIYDEKEGEETRCGRRSLCAPPHSVQ